MTVVFASAPAASAQENGNRDEDGKVVRGPYETNSFGDNWFIGVRGGINVFWTEGNKLAIGPSIDADFGKWFTPSMGMRVGYQGFQSKTWTSSPSIFSNTLNTEKDMYEQKFGYMYFHGDFLWNMSNALGGYKETRFWNLIPYLHAGFYRSYGLNDVDFGQNELAMGAGLLHNLRLTDRLDIVIDMRATVLNGRDMEMKSPSLLGSVTAGLAVDLGWPNFIRTSTVLGEVELANAEKLAVLETAALALEAANAALENQNQQLATKNKKLSTELDDLRKQVAELPDDLGMLSDMKPVVYFEIGQTVLSPLEMKHLEFIAQNIISKADEGKVTITVIGSADGNTGTERRNQQLSQARGKYVADILTGKYGIDPDRITVTSEVVKAADDPQFDRAVIFTF